MQGRVEKGRGGGGAGGCGIAFGESDELVGKTLGFFGFGPGGADGFVLNKRGNEIAEECDAVGGFAAEVPVLKVAAGHGCGWVR